MSRVPLTILGCGVPGFVCRYGRIRAPPMARGVTLAGCACVVCAPSATAGNHGNAIDRARRNAQLTAGTQRGQHSVHSFRRANNGVDRAGCDAERAADARCLVDARDRQRTRFPTGAVEYDARAHGDLGEYRNKFVGSRRTAIDCSTVDDGFRVRPTAVVAAASALHLREDDIDAVGEVARKCMGTHRSILACGDTLQPVWPVPPPSGRVIPVAPALDSDAGRNPDRRLQ